MNTRLLIITILGILMVGGLIAGFFAGTIEHALIVTPPAKSTVRSQASTMPTQTMPAQTLTTLLAQDTFKRNNQPLWGAASDMRQWEGDANSPNDRAIFTIANATGQIAKGQGTFNAIIGQANTNEEVMITGQINRFANGANIGAVLRWQDIKNWYKVLIDGTHLRILKNVQGTSSVVATAPFQAQGGVLYALRFRAIGAMLFARVWRNDMPEPATWTITTTDNVLNSGQVGIRVLVNQASIVTITSFKATLVSNM